MDLSELRVVVVGGAIGGASAALALARAGAQVTLLERLPSARAAGAGIALAENGLAVLEALGVHCESSSLAGVRVTDARGRTLFTPSSHDGGAPRLAMARRSTLYAALADAVARSPIDARYGNELTDLRDIRADLIVGADGVHSRVRAQAGFVCRVRKSGVSYARGLARAGLAQNVEAWTSAGLFGSFDVPDGTYWYASLGASREQWARAYPPSEALFAEPLINEVIEVECASFARDNCVLIGDAAHAMAPNLGQGANSALVDAAVLCSELINADSLAAGLAAYDQRRRPKVRQVARTAARLGKLAELTNPLLRALRDRVLMPLASRGDGRAAARMALQEAPAALRASLAQLAI